MKWMIAGKLSLHDGCHYINPDHADHKDPIVWLQTRPKELSIYFSITRNQAPQADPQKMGTKCRATFSPITPGYSLHFHEVWKQEWRHLAPCKERLRMRSECLPDPASNQAGPASGARPGPASHAGQYPSGFFCCQFQLSAHICCRSRCARQPSSSAASDGSA